MPTCLFCKRDALPLVPMTTIAAGIIAAHVTKKGEPCLQGTTAEQLAASLPDDYPRAELWADDDWWEFGRSPRAGVPAGVQFVDQHMAPIAAAPPEPDALTAVHLEGAQPIPRPPAKRVRKPRLKVVRDAE